MAREAGLTPLSSHLPSATLIATHDGTCTTRRKWSGGGVQWATRLTAEGKARRGVCPHMTSRPPIRAAPRGASSGERGQPLPTSGRGVVSADGWWLQLPKLLEPRPQQGSVRPARAPLSAGAAVTITTTSAKGVGDNKSRRSHSPPTCARGTAPPQVSCRRPDSRRQAGQGGCAAATAARRLCLNLPPPRGTLRAARPRTAARKRPPQPRAALGGHAGVGGVGGRRGGWLANGLAVGDETRLGEGALSVRSMTTGLGGSS